MNCMLYKENALLYSFTYANQSCDYKINALGYMWGVGKSQPKCTDWPCFGLKLA